MKNETPQIETMYRQVRGDHERRLLEAERRRRHAGGRPLRPGLRQAPHRLAAWIAAVVRPRARVEADAAHWRPLVGCDPTVVAGSRTDLLR